MRKHGRSGFRSPSRTDGRSSRSSSSEDDDDDVLAHPDRMRRVGKKPNRGGNIRFGSGIGRNRDLGGSPPPRREYRDRRDFPSRNSRQRSFSPSPQRFGKSRGGNARYPRGGRRGGRGRENYRPTPPSSGYRGRDKFRH